MQNENDEQNLFDKDLLSLIEYAKWELYNFNLLKKSSKIVKSELLLIDRDTLRKWKEISGYNIFKKQIFSYLFTLNKIKNFKDKIKQEKQNINLKWQSIIKEKKIDLKNINSFPLSDLSGLYLNIKDKKINAYKNYEVISSKLFNIFKKFINHKIIVNGIYNNRKLIIPINYEKEMNLNKSMKTGENFLEIIYLNNKNELEDMLCILPDENDACKQIEDYYSSESIDNLKDIFSKTSNANNQSITDFIDINENKVQIQIINKKYYKKTQDNPYKSNNEKNNGIELEKLKLILSEKISILQEVNKRINQRNNNIIKLKSNDINKNRDEQKQKLEEIKNDYLRCEKEYKNIKNKLELKKKSLNDKEKLIQNLDFRNNDELKFEEEEEKFGDVMCSGNNEIKSELKLDNNNNYLLKEKKLKENETYLNKKENELNRKENNLRKRELEVNDEKQNLLNKEKELEKKLNEINEQLIIYKNKNYLMNIKEEKEDNISQDNNINKELDKLEEEFEKELDSSNKSSKCKIKKINMQKKISNDYNTINLTSLTHRSPTNINKSPENFKYKRTNTLTQNFKNISHNEYMNTERKSLPFNIKRNLTFNENLISPPKNKNTQLKRNNKINQKETKINKNITSLGLEETDHPININAVLQCLAHIPELAEGILELGYKEKYFKENKNVELSRNFASIVNNLFFPEKYDNKSKIYSPKNFVETFLNMYPLKNYETPVIYLNMNEMFKFILETFHNELNIKKKNNIKENTDSKEENKNDLSNEKEVLVKFLTKFTENNNSLISKLFYGLTKFKCICDKCGSTKYDFDYYNHLYFDIHKIKEYMKNNKFKRKNIGFLSINDCLDYQRRDINLKDFFKEINLSILEKFKINNKSGKAFCDKCQKETKWSLYNYLYSANTILPIILNRGNDDDYLIEEIIIPEELNLENYVEYNKSVKKYYLCGVVSNLGKNNTNGRFIAYCRMTYNGKWFRYFNEKISSCKLNEIFTEGVPYLIIYHKI